MSHATRREDLQVRIEMYCVRCLFGDGPRLYRRYAVHACVCAVVCTQFRKLKIIVLRKYGEIYDEIGCVIINYSLVNYSTRAQRLFEKN